MPVTVGGVVAVVMGFFWIATDTDKRHAGPRTVCKARRHPILENLQPERPVAGVNMPEPPHSEHAYDCEAARMPQQAAW